MRIGAYDSGEESGETRDNTATSVTNKKNLHLLVEENSTNDPNYIDEIVTTMDNDKVLTALKTNLEISLTSENTPENGEKISKQLDEVQARRSKLMDSIQNKWTEEGKEYSFNPFVEESKNIQKVIPIRDKYNKITYTVIDRNKTRAASQVDSIASSMQEGDDFGMLFHSGTTLSGTKLDKIAQPIAKKDPETGYMMTCYGGDCAETVKGEMPEDTDVYYRPETPWQGVYTGGKTIETALYGRNLDEVTRNPVKGVDYEIRGQQDKQSVLAAVNNSRAHNGLRPLTADQIDMDGTMSEDALRQMYGISAPVSREETPQISPMQPVRTETNYWESINSNY